MLTFCPFLDSRPGLAWFYSTSDNSFGPSVIAHFRCLCILPELGLGPDIFQHLPVRLFFFKVAKLLS